MTNMTPAKRINEFTKRQIFYDESFTTRLNAVKGKWVYTTTVWVKESINPVVVDTGKYNGEDPITLIELARSMFGRQKTGSLELKPEMVRGQAEKGIKVQPKRPKKLANITNKEISN